LKNAIIATCTFYRPFFAILNTFCCTGFHWKWWNLQL